MTAFSHAALHIALKCGDNVSLLESQFKEVLYDKPEHDRRTADKSYCVIHRDLYSRFPEQASYDTHVAGPAFFSAVHGEGALNAGRFLPFTEIGRVHQFLRSLRAVVNLDALIFIAVFKRINNTGAQRNQSYAAGDENKVLPVIIQHRETIAVWTTHRKLVAG